LIERKRERERASCLKENKNNERVSFSHIDGWMQNMIEKNSALKSTKQSLYMMMKTTKYVCVVFCVCVVCVCVVCVCCLCVLCVCVVCVCVCVGPSEARDRDRKKERERKRGERVCVCVCVYVCVCCVCV
jgi:hypothetical protein